MSIQTDEYWNQVIDPGDRASKFAKEVCFRSHGNSDKVTIVPLQPGNFRGPVGFLWKPDLLRKMADHEISPDGVVTRWELMEAVEDDGAGVKPQFFTLLGEEEPFRNLGWEVISMVADDFSRTGRLAVVMDNEVNAKRITDKNFHLFEAMMEGYSDALAKSRLVNITGEVAIMKHSITAFCDAGEDSQLVLTWGGSCVGLCDREKLINPALIKPGMSVIGLHEHGYRCNGGTFFTNVILNKWGINTRELFENPDVRTFVRKLTAPSISFAGFIAELVGWYSGVEEANLPDIAGIAHITGGGIWGKFKEMLPAGVGADLDRMPEPPAVLLEAQNLSVGSNELSDWKAHGTLHGGVGMLIVCPEESEGIILRHAERSGKKASKVGVTTSSEKNEVVISSRFRQGSRLSSEHPE